MVENTTNVVNPEPAPTPSGPKERKLALEERARVEGFSDYADHNPRWDHRAYNPNRLWCSKTRNYK